jgi:para-nitrobenzyl esterase
MANNALEYGVTTSKGEVIGTVEGHSVAYRGIPYAATPTGAGRFAAPRRADPWSAPLGADAARGTQPQPRRDGFGQLNMSPFFGPGWIRDGESLTVNVWTPTDPPERPLPVLVFVHGGGFVAGSNHATLLNGATFARDGVIFVGVSYRLGVTGFASVPDAPDNRGALDVVAALRWVQDEIAAFGGDPTRVTLAGQSAGATLVGTLLADPEARGLFSAAIIQSGNGRGAFSPGQAAVVTRRLAGLLDIDATATALADIDDEQLLSVLPGLAGLDLRVDGLTDPLAGLSPFAPVLDTQPAASVAAGRGAPVPLLIGTMSEEGRLYVVPSGADTTTTRAEVETIVRSVIPAGQDPQTVLDAYRAADPDGSWGDIRAAVLGDAMFKSGTRALAAAHAGAGHPLHQYEFAWQSTALGGRLGSAHTVDLPFVFDRVEAEDLVGDGKLLGESGGPAGLAAEVHAAWVSFVTTGSPGWEGSTVAAPRTRSISESWGWADVQPLPLDA